MQLSAPSETESGARPVRIGVFGGTFDPPHIGHLWLATLAADTLDLGRVLLMPAALVVPAAREGRDDRETSPVG